MIFLWLISLDSHFYMYIWGVHSSLVFNLVNDNQKWDKSSSVSLKQILELFLQLALSGRKTAGILIVKIPSTGFIANMYNMYEIPSTYFTNLC